MIGIWQLNARLLARDRARKWRSSMRDFFCFNKKNEVRMMEMKIIINTENIIVLNPSRDLTKFLI